MFAALGASLSLCRDCKFQKQGDSRAVDVRYVLLVTKDKCPTLLAWCIACRWNEETGILSRLTVQYAELNETQVTVSTRPTDWAALVYSSIQLAGP